MLSEVVLQHRIVGTVLVRGDFCIRIVFGLFRRISAGCCSGLIADGDLQAAAVVAVIGLGVHGEGQDISLLHVIFFAEGHGPVLCEVALDLVADPLLFLAVYEETDDGAVGFGIRSVLELGVAAGHIDLAGLGSFPSVGSVPAVAGLHIVCLELGLAAVVITVVVGVIGKLLEFLAVPVAHAVGPAVASLLAEIICENGVVGAVVILLLIVTDGDCQAASVIGIVAFRVDRKGQDITFLYFIDILEGIGSVFSEVAEGLISHPLLLFAVNEEAYAGAVGIAVCAVCELGVVNADRDGAILGCGPPVGGVPALSGFHEVCLKLGLAAVVIAVIIGVVGKL